MSKRNQGADRLEISFCQKGKWDRGWLEQWFYVKTYGVRGTTEDGAEVVQYPLTSRMEVMAPHTRVDPPEQMSLVREAYDRAFAAACRYPGGRDLVEEIMASNYWPLGRDNPAFRLEKVKVPIFGPKAGISFPRFGRSLGEGVTEDSFVADVEEATVGLVSKIFEREYTSQRAVAGTMPWLNRIFEELGIVYREREVPVEVLASIDKKKKSSAKNITAEAESKKRKGAALVRAPTKKKKKTGALVITPAASSAGSAGVASADSEDVQSSSIPSRDVRVVSGGDNGSLGAPARSVRGARSGAERPKASAAPACSLRGAVSGAEQPEASVANPMPDIFGGLYSSSEEGVEVVL
jgi:hypothetical protein